MNPSGSPASRPVERAVTVDLLHRYDRPGPRYTSYPTAVEFHDGVQAHHYESHLAAAAATDEPLSLYVHLPFCEHRCLFCGCHVIITPHRERAAPYLELLQQEIELLARHLPGRRSFSQLHLGGGTPTYHSPAELRTLLQHLFRHFRPAPLAIEMIEKLHDPHFTTEVARFNLEFNSDPLEFGGGCLRALEAQHVLLFLALSVGNDDHRAKAERIGDEREPNAGIASGAFDDRSARLQQSLCAGVFDDRQRGAVLHGAAGIEIFSLGVDFDARKLGIRLFQPQQGRVADLLEQGRRGADVRGGFREGESHGVFIDFSDLPNLCQH